jgi:hypothetical protein
MEEINPKSALLGLVRDFHDWADRYPVGERSAEWESEYDHWPEINTAFRKFLDASGTEKWDSATTDLVLYILARDNETEMLKEELILRPPILLSLATAGLQSSENDARWQLADALGNVELSENQAEQMLEEYCRDENEYVSRRALLALARRRSAKVEPLAIRAWETGHEYQRIAALEALASCNSSLLPTYLKLARQDGRQHLVSNAFKLDEPGGS